MLEDHTFPVLSVQMPYRVRARNETAGATGLAHFLEHMAFRSAQNFPGTGLVSSIYAVGGECPDMSWVRMASAWCNVSWGHVSWGPWGLVGSGRELSHLSTRSTVLSHRSVWRKCTKHDLTLVP